MPKTGLGDVHINKFIRDFDFAFYQRVRKIPYKWTGEALANRFGFKIPEWLGEEERPGYAVRLLDSIMALPSKTTGFYRLHNWRAIEAKRLRYEHRLKWARIHHEREQEELRIKRKLAAQQLREHNRVTKPIRQVLVTLIGARADFLEEREIQRSKDKAERDRRIVAYYQRQERLRTPQRDRRIWLLRREGYTFATIGRWYCISKENVRRICARQDRMEIGRALRFRKRLSASGQTRPIDMGGPRGVWITCTPENPEGVIP